MLCPAQTKHFTSRYKLIKFFSLKFYFSFAENTIHSKFLLIFNDLADTKTLTYLKALQLQQKWSLFVDKLFN